MWSGVESVEIAKNAKGYQTANSSNSNAPPKAKGLDRVSLVDLLHYEGITVRAIVVTSHLKLKTEEYCFLYTFTHNFYSDSMCEKNRKGCMYINMKN